MDFYLITGFLGAGKTTFLKEFVKNFTGKRLWLIINEFGKAGVDGALLQEVGATLSEITNGSIFCACRLDRFEEVLQEAVENHPDVILVEASGLADPTSVQRVLRQDAFQEIVYRGSVCLIDAPRLEKVIHTARVCPLQIMISSLVLLNKTDLATPQQLNDAREMILGKNPAAVIRETSFGVFQPQWMEDIHPLGGDELPSSPDIRLQKFLLQVKEEMNLEQLEKALRMIGEDSWRMKGILKVAEGTVLVDCVGPDIHVETTDLQPDCENRLVLLAGPGMALRKAMKQAIAWYPTLLKEVWE